MTEYAGSNSNKSKEAKARPEKARPERVTTGDVKVKSKSIGQKFKGIFFTGNFKQSVSHVVAEVLLPAARNTLSDAGKGILDRVIYGDSARGRRQYDYRGSSRVQYSSPFSRIQYAGRSASPPDQAPRPMRGGSREANDILMSSREEAQVVLERLTDIVDQYEMASLADLYDLVGLPSSHVDNKWGWTYLTNATIRQAREGFYLELPPMESL